jgi:hypothetical protein
MTARADIDRAARVAERRSRMVVHRAHSFEDAERWDLEFWQSQSPEDRLSALVDIRHDVAMVRQARRHGRKPAL